jgi:Asp/Glu/hydantoin racemase
MRICYQSTTALSDMGSYARRLRQHAADVLLPDTAVHVQGIDPALYGDLVPGDIYPYPYLKLMIQNAALEACVEAEKAGFDAFVIGSFSEPHLRQSRSAVDIPVVSMPETAMLTACSLAERFALVTLSPHYARRLTEVVARHGMAPRLAGIYTLGEGLDERGASAALDDPRPVIDALQKLAAEAIEAGADLLIPSEGILNEVLYAHRIREVQGAAVMDCVGLALMQAEMFVRARRTIGLTYGRAWSYPLAPPALQARMRRNAGLPDLSDATR